MHQDEAWHQERPKEECGVVGLYVPGEEASRMIFFALFALQHRGQESSGIAVTDGTAVRMHKDMGLVSSVFDETILKSLPGDMGVGHNRYSTSGSSVHRNAQPIHCISEIGEIAVAHNGNLINAYELRKEMEAEGETFVSTADSEVIARLLVRNMKMGPEHAISATMQKLKGAYSVTVLTPRMVMGFRDPSGVRPLTVGRLGNGYMIASETCAFEPVGGVVEQEVHPGEFVIIDEKGMRMAQAVPAQPESMCLFEFIYFARPDSVMFNTSLYNARVRMGENLWKEHPVVADIVVPVPDSGIPAAIGYARASGIPFGEGMMKSRYIHRTFIQPDQRMRELGVRMKLAPLKENIEGKRVVLVDDSIVRGTTTNQIVKMMFDAGAKEVHVRITAPPIKFPCFYGIDMASKGELIAAVKSIDEISQHLGASSLGYLSVDGAMDAVGEGERRFCRACFTGNYPIPVPDKLSKLAFEEPPDVGEMATVSTGQMSLPVED
ncbi:MAG: amidophosphoribosyltransferase [Armatimonadetes bacterium]|nr:amidophosphoribosyltransferase [Armatimonadota bacterium]